MKKFNEAYNEWEAEQIGTETNEVYDQVLKHWTQVSNSEVAANPRRYKYEGQTFTGKDGRRWRYYRRGNELKVAPAY